MDTVAELHKAVLAVYHDFLDVFRKRGDDTNPPHRPYDFPLQLLPGVEILFGRIFPLS